MQPVQRQHGDTTPVTFTSSHRFNRAHVGGIVGLLGLTIVAVATTLTAFAYRGRAGESYSPLNHFVSELGHTQVSPWAPVFNTGLIVGNTCLVFFTLAVARHLGGKLGSAFAVLALISNLAGALVGVTPMNILVPHLLVAFVFFYSCLASIVVFTMHTLLFRPSGRWIALPGCLSIACFTVFLGDSFLLRHDLHAIFHLLSHRPVVWLLPMSEWSVFLSIMLWMVLVAWQLRTEANPRANSTA